MDSSKIVEVRLFLGKKAVDGVPPRPYPTTPLMLPPMARSKLITESGVHWEGSLTDAVLHAER